MIRERFDFNVIPLRFANAPADLGVYRLRKLPIVVKVAFAILRSCMLWRPDLVYFTLAPTGPAFIRDAFYTMILRVMRVPYVLHLHGKGVSATTVGLLGRRLYRWVLTKAFVIHLSPRLYGDISGFVEKERCYYVPNGIPDSGMTPNRASKRLANTPIRILYLSNMGVSKGPLVLLDALRILKDRRLPFEAIFAGAWKNDPCRDEFGARVKRHRLEDQVRYLGAVHGSEKDGLYQHADVFVLPTQSDCFPLVLLEAMCHGIATVSTIEGAIPDIIVDGATGYLIPPGDPGSLADRLAMLAADVDLAARMGRAGRLRFEELYTIARFERDLRNVLVHILEATGSKLGSTE